MVSFSSSLVAEGTDLAELITSVIAVSKLVVTRSTSEEEGFALARVFSAESRAFWRVVHFLEVVLKSDS